MVTWSEDANLDRICEGINKGISRFKMKDYHIYGLKQEDRPHVRISPECPSVLKDLFTRSDYTIEVQEENRRYHAACDANHSDGDCCCDLTAEGGCDYCNPNTINIGLRRDVRSNIKIARKLIKTIIFAVEGKLIIDDKAKMNLGKRVQHTEVKVPATSKTSERPEATVTPQYVPVPPVLTNID